MVEKEKKLYIRILVNWERVAEPNEFADGNVVLDKTKVFNVFIFEGDKCSVVGCDFAVVG